MGKSSDWPAGRNGSPARRSHLAAYPLMLRSRRLEERILELFQKGYVKGTVTISVGNEATTIGAAMPFRPGQDVVSLLHRDFGGHLLLGATPYKLLCQYLANADSPTHGREGNVHHGDAARAAVPDDQSPGQDAQSGGGRRLGGAAPRRRGLRPGGHRRRRLQHRRIPRIAQPRRRAKIARPLPRRKQPLFLLHADQRPVHSARLSDRAAAYAISGRTIDGTDPWEVYVAVNDALDAMRDDSSPAILECMTLRLHGHAAYDKGGYVPEALAAKWRAADPLPRARETLRELCGLSESEIKAIDDAVEEETQEAVKARWRLPGRAAGRRLLDVRPRRRRGEGQWRRRGGGRPRVKPLQARGVKCGDAVRMALEYILANNPAAFLAGLDVGVYGSAFKTCKGLIDRFGPERVIDMPLCESAMMGFALGASQTGGRPIFEFQFADFSTETATQLGLNAATWHFRSGCPAPMLIRLPCGGGMTVGAFHSGEFEGLWSRFPGLKLLYPATPQETFESLVAGFYDPNPCLVFEHKLLYWSRGGDVDFDGDLAAVWRPRRYTEGSDLTLVAFGAMTHEARCAAARSGHSVEVWNPLVLQPLDLGPIYASIRKTGRLLVGAGGGRDARAGRPDHFLGGAGVFCVVAMSAAVGRGGGRGHAVCAGTGVLRPARRGADRRGHRPRCWQVFMDEPLFRMPLYLPAQGASETEATIIEWHVAEGDRFAKGQALAQIDSAKSVFDFEAPCDGLAIRIFRLEGETVPLSEPLLEIETWDAAMHDWIPPAGGEPPAAKREAILPAAAAGSAGDVILRGVGGYLPSRAVDNDELTRGFPEISRAICLRGDGHSPPALGKRGGAALRHGLQGVAGGDPQVGNRHEGHRRDHRRHDHPGRCHALDRLHPARPPLPANGPRVRSERGLFRLALRGGDGPGHDPLRHRPQRVDRRR